MRVAELGPGHSGSSFQCPYSPHAEHLRVALRTAWCSTFLLMSDGANALFFLTWRSPCDAAGNFSCLPHDAAARCGPAFVLSMCFFLTSRSPCDDAAEAGSCLPRDAAARFGINLGIGSAGDGSCVLALVLCFSLTSSSPCDAAGAGFCLPALGLYFARVAALDSSPSLRLARGTKPPEAGWRLGSLGLGRGGAGEAASALAVA